MGFGLMFDKGQKQSSTLSCYSSYTIYSLFMDIHNLFKDIRNSFMDILNSFMDILGYHVVYGRGAPCRGFL